jgi:Ni/Co efflux regulator RcnB
MVAPIRPKEFIMIKSAVLAALALSLLAVPAAQAQQRHDGGPVYSQQHKASPQRHATPPRHVQRHQWKRGQHVSNWRRQPVVRDYKRRGLRQPARGQQWVQVDNTYLLISLATGAILNLANTR